MNFLHQLKGNKVLISGDSSGQQREIARENSTGRNEKNITEVESSGFRNGLGYSK